MQFLSQVTHFVCFKNKHLVSNRKFVAAGTVFLQSSGGSDDLGLGVQQDCVGVRPRPQDPVAVVKMIVERLGDLVGAAALVVLLSVRFTLGGGPLVSGRGASLLQVDQVRFSGPGAVVLLSLQGNQRRWKT